MPKPTSIAGIILPIALALLLADTHAQTAWEAVTKIWVPQGAWKKLIQQQLQKHHINFEPF